MNATETLIAAKALIDTPEKWTTGSYSRDENNNCLPDIFDPAACKFCSLGAIERVSPEESKWMPNSFAYLARCFLNKAIDSISRHAASTIVRFNDNSTHEQVMKAFDKAIEISKKKEIS